MLTKLVALALFGLAFAETSEREKRQVAIIGGNSCQVQLQNNPCQSGQGRVYYEVPNDYTKFIQCDVLGRAYVVQCPAGLYYNQASTSCVSVPPNPTQPAPATGPCTAQAIATGQIYFSFPGDNTKFYECTGVGTLQVLQCPTNLVWDTSRKACTYVAGTIISPTTASPFGPQFTNPCTPQQLAGNHYYFAHPDPTRFIQCDNAGDAFVVSCPSGLVWNQYYETCSSAFANAVLG